MRRVVCKFAFYMCLRHLLFVIFQVNMFLLSWPGKHIMAESLFVLALLRLPSSFTPLTLNTLWAKSADDKFLILFPFFFFFFFQEIGFNILCKLSPKETICMKRQTLFYGKKENIIQNIVCWFYTQHAKRYFHLLPVGKGGYSSSPSAHYGAAAPLHQTLRCCYKDKLPLAWPFCTWS